MTLYNETSTLRAIDPTQQSGDESDSLVIDRIQDANRFQELMFMIVVGQIHDGIYELSLEECDDYDGETGSWQTVEPVGGGDPPRFEDIDYTGQNQIYTIPYVGSMRWVRAMVRRNVDDPIDLRPGIIFTPTATGADVFDYSGANAITFTVANDADGYETTLVLDDDYVDSAGVAAALTAQLHTGWEASAISADMVQIEWATFLDADIVVGGDDEEAITGSADYLMTPGMQQLGGYFSAVALAGKPYVYPVR